MPFYLFTMWYQHGIIMTEVNTMNEVAFTVRMDKALKARLETLAEKDGRSLNNLMNKIARDYCDKEKEDAKND